MDSSSGLLRKRPRPAEDQLDENAGVVASSGLLRSSLSASSSVQAVCTVASHARLDALVKQMDLLRRMDADAHEAVTAELNEQIIRLRGQVESLTAALEASTKRAADAFAALQQQQGQHSGGDSSSSGAGSSSSSNSSSAPSSSSSGNDASSLRKQVAAKEAEAAVLRGQNEHLSREVARLKKESAETSSMRAASTSQMDQAVAALQQQLGAANQELAALRAFKATASTFSSSSSGSTSSSSSSDSDKQLRELREALRQAERRERMAAAELSKKAQEAGNAELLREQLDSMQLKARRLEAAAATASVSETRLFLVAEALERWEGLYHSSHGGSSIGKRASLVELLQNAKQQEQQQQQQASSGAGEGDTSSSSSSSFATALSEALALSGHLCSSVEASLQDLQASNEGLTQRLNEARGALEASRGACKRLEERVEAVESDRQALSARASESEVQCYRLQRQVSMSKQQVESLRSLVASYEAENKAFASTSSTTSASKQSGAAAGEAALVTSLRSRVRSLEELFVSAHEAIASSHEDVAALVAASRLNPQGDAASTSSSSGSSSLSSVLPSSTLELRNRSLAAEVSLLKGELDMLYSKYASAAAASSSADAIDRDSEDKEGSSNSSDGGDAAGKRLRVLHFSANPSAAALKARDASLTAQAAALSKENEALRQQVEASAGSLATAFTKIAALTRQLGQQTVSAQQSEQAATEAQQQAASAAAASALLNVSAFGSSLLSGGVASGAGTALNTTTSHHPASSSSSSSSTSSVEVEKLKQRMKEKFTEYRDALRAAVYRLTGWKIDVRMGQMPVMREVQVQVANADGTVTTTTQQASTGQTATYTDAVLRSMYAESDEDYLKFRITRVKNNAGNEANAASGGAGGYNDDDDSAGFTETIEVQESPFYSRLDGSITAYIDLQKAYPCFSAALTLALFEQSTVGMGGTLGA